MSLRLRLILALAAMALIPMAIALVVPLSRAERAAQEQARARAESATARGAAAIAREVGAQRARFDRAARELAANDTWLQGLLRGPEPVARTAAAALAREFGLAQVEIEDGAGQLLAHAPQERSTVVAALRYETGIPAGDETLTLRAAIALDRAWLESIADVAGVPAMLLEDRHLVWETAARDRSRAWLESELPIAEQRLVVVLATPGGDVGAARQAALASFFGIAPLALGGALVIGLLLAHGIARPIRALTARAERIAAERARPILLSDDRNEVRRLQNALEQMLDALDGSERQRLAAERIAAWEEVARRLAHEVKNPLSPIQLAVENLRRTFQRAPQDYPRALEQESATILEEVASLRRLVDEFAEFARLPKLELAPCAPAELVHRVVSLHQSRIDQLGVRVVITDDESPESLQADPEQLSRVLKNLVQNALDALEPAANRQLSIVVRGEGPPEARSCAIELRDSGVGLTPEAARRVFEPYYTTKLGSGGTGLGMAIVQRIVTEHGGTVRIDGAPGSGATVTVRLPLDGPPR